MHRSEYSAILEELFREDTEAPRGGVIPWLLVAILSFVVGCLAGWTASAFYWIARVMGL